MSKLLTLAECKQLLEESEELQKKVLELRTLKSQLENSNQVLAKNVQLFESRLDEAKKNYDTVNMANVKLQTQKTKLIEDVLDLSVKYEDLKRNHKRLMSDIEEEYKVLNNLKSYRKQFV